MRQRLKSLIKPRGRPHLKQRLTFLDENLGLILALCINDFFAMLVVLTLSAVEGLPDYLEFGP